MSEVSLDAHTRTRIEDFITDCAHCIDDDDLERWPEFFAEDALYQIVPLEGFEAGHRLGVMLCRGRGMMTDRVRAMRHANIYEPQRYTHILSRSQLKSGDSRVYARTNFHVVRTMQDGGSETFVTGKYVDEIRVDAERVQFLERRVVLDSRRIDTLLVVPL